MRPCDGVVNGASYGTLFLAVPRPLGGRKRWILLIPANGGAVQVDPRLTLLASTLETKKWDAAFEHCFQLQPAPLRTGDIVVNKRAETALNNDKNLSGFHIVSVTGRANTSN